jgi:outer membrane protein
MRDIFFRAAAAVAIVSVAPMARAETLADALTAAYAHNPTLEAARANARAADETYPQARAGLLPQVSANASLGTRRTEIEAPQTNFAPTTLTKTQPGTYGVQATQSLFAGGRNFGRLKQANANIEAAQESLRATEQSILLQVVSAYMNVRRDAAILSIRANNAELLVKQVEEAKARFDVGEITKTDVAQSQARLAGARAQLALARADLEASRANYLELVGNPPGELAPPPPTPPLPETLDGAVDQGLKANPDYLRLVETARAARAQIMIERADLLPQVSVTGRLDHAFEDRQRLGGRLIGDTDSASAFAQLTIPLYQGGLARSQVAQARDEYNRADLSAAAARRQVVTDVTNAWNNLDAVRQTIAASREQVEANQLAYDGAVQEREVGLRTTIEVLNAQQELLDSRVALVRSERDAYVAAGVLLQAAGSLDPKTLGVNAPLYDPDKHRKAVRWRF